MKKIFLIITTFLILVVAFEGVTKYKHVPVEAEEYVEQKKWQESAAFYRQLDSIYGHHEIEIYPLYSGYKSRFLKQDVEEQTGDNFKDVIRGAYWKPQLSDITSTYYVAPEDESPYTFSQGRVSDVKDAINSSNLYDSDYMRGLHGGNRKGIWQTGWALGVREYDAEGIREYVIIPYAISFRKSNAGSMVSIQDYYSIDAILNNAYRFYTENEESPFKRKIVSNIRNFVYKPYVENDYYYLDAPQSVKDPLIMSINSSALYERGRYMYNNYYYVFIKAYDYKRYDRVLNERVVDLDKRDFISQKRKPILLIIIPSLGILLTIWIILLVYLIRGRIENRKTMQQRLLSKCNPKLFVKNYNEAKLKSANDIYSKALNVDYSDDVVIKELATRAESELGVELVSKNDIKVLQKKCNPKKFMKPYDADKIAKANSLFSRLMQDKICYSDFIVLQQEVESLYM